MNISVTPAFLPGSCGQIFTITYSNKAKDHSLQPNLLFIPPFAEEANKSRHMLSALGRSLASNGIKTTIIDLYGCGDSEGDIDQVNLKSWHQDISNVLQHIQQHSANTSRANISIGGLRLGATIAIDFLAKSQQQVDNLLLWQPVVKGEQFMKQFIRLKIAESITKSSAPTTSTSQIIAELENGNTQEISGYQLTKDLFQDISALSCLHQNIATDTQLHLLEINPSSAPSIPMVKAVSSYENINASHHICQGSQFWSCQEIVWCNPAIDKSVEILTSGSVL